MKLTIQTFIDRANGDYDWPYKIPLDNMHNRGAIREMERHWKKCCPDFVGGPIRVATGHIPEPIAHLYCLSCGHWDNLIVIGNTGRIPSELKG